MPSVCRAIRTADTSDGEDDTDPDTLLDDGIGPVALPALSTHRIKHSTCVGREGHHIPCTRGSACAECHTGSISDNT